MAGFFTITPKTIEQGYEGEVKVTLRFDNLGRNQYFFRIRNDSLSPTERLVALDRDNLRREQATTFTVPSNIARGQHVFVITGANTNATNQLSQLPAAGSAGLTFNVNTETTGVATGFNIAFTNGTVNRGDEIFLTMSIRGPSDVPFVYRLDADADVFESINSTFTIQGTEQIRTFLRVKADATYTSGTITIVPVNNHAIGQQALLTSSGNSTHGFTVQEVPQPSVDSFDITFSPNQVEREHAIFVTMNATNLSDHSFVFRLVSTVDVFEAGAYEFTIESGEEVKTFARVRADAELEPGVLRIVPVNAAAIAVSAELTAANNEHAFTVIETPETMPDTSVPIDFDMDTVRQYFEEVLFVERFRLPTIEGRPVSPFANQIEGNNLVLTNIRIQLDADDVYQVPFIAENALPADYLQQVDSYPGKSWMRLSIREGASTQITVGTTAVYRFSGVAFFQVFVKQNLSSPETRSIHTELAKYILGWKSFRRQNGAYTNVSVSPPSSSFGIDAVSDGWSQSNLSFPFTYDVSI